MMERPNARLLADVDRQFIHPALKPAYGAPDQGRRSSRPEASTSSPGSLQVRPVFPGLPISALSPNMNVLSAAGGLAISGSSTGMMSPFFPYPGLLSATDELKYLSMAQIQAANQAHFVGELTKMKQPMLTKNYLELAMLVCNTFRGKLFPCPHCRYVTDRRNNLKRHVATMHQACDKQLECCGVTFATKASLREHITIFHHNGYSCPFCGRRFCRKALLKRHLSVHSGQKDYTCPHCDYATSHKSNLERHKRIHARLQIMGESGLEDIPRDVNAMFSESGLHSVESHISEMERHAPVSQHCVHETEKHHWTDYRNEESVRDSMEHTDDPEDCDVDIDDDSEDDEMYDRSLAVEGQGKSFQSPAGHFCDVPKTEHPVNLVTESNARATAAAQLVSRLTHGFAVPLLGRDSTK
ncbi:zinc finger protein 311 [Biomphalaria pfeifferi]|uniref:Zinc finger protein 311 n=1 Tax=Biomphalaria pfeifferi TaxID=112525 RepID=A0AAD8AQC7_BIOPF|nr:zinc finger protein 311 [Biomphalaria pfeifferi]